MDRVLKKSTPKLSDIAIEALQDVLADNLVWLNYIFGRCQKIQSLVSGRNKYYPAIHVENNEYRSLLPDQQLGNFCFFVVDDPEKYQHSQNSYGLFTVNMSIVFWFNVNDVLQNYTDRSLELIKSEILNVLIRSKYKSYGVFDLQEIFEESSNVYKDFSIEEVDTQYLMQPFAGFRFSGKLKFSEPC